MANKKLNIINIMISSINGKIAFHSNESSAQRNANGFTCVEDFEHMRGLVATCDVVFHGARSIESEAGAFRVAHLRSTKDEPEWIIFTRSGNISFQSPFWRQKGIPKSLFFVSSFNINEDPILKIETQDFYFGKLKCYLGNISGLIQYLENKSYTKAALLGGGKLNAVFWDNNLVHDLYLTLSPFLVGMQEAPNLIDSYTMNFSTLLLNKCYTNNHFVYLHYKKAKK